MSAYQKSLEVQQRLAARGIIVTIEQAETLRRAEKTLHRWAELECGDGDNYKSWSIERDEKTGKPFMCVYPHTGEMRRYRIADKEAGALKRVKTLCDKAGLSFYHQGDPRGAALYVSKEAMTDRNYTNGVYCGAAN